jgi:DHA1 family tetracycline resistance protein-like MFS transporter
MSHSTFKSGGLRNFIPVVFAYTMDLLGFSIVFPILAPLLLDTKLHFFSAQTSEIARTSFLGLLFAVFGLAQFMAAPLVGAAADRWGRKTLFLLTIGVSVIGYSLMCFGIYLESLSILVFGRIITGFSSGNISIAQSATADMTEPEHRGKAFSLLMGIGSIGFIGGPVIGGKLASIQWLSGSASFLFAAAAALLNFLVIWIFFHETWKRPTALHEHSYFDALKDIRLLFKQKSIIAFLFSFLFLVLGWGFFLTFSPTYFTQHFDWGPEQIGNLYAYMTIFWFLGSTFINPALLKRWRPEKITPLGLAIASLGMALLMFPSNAWPIWLVCVVMPIGGSCAWVDLTTLISTRCSPEMQGRALGVTASLWSIAQTLSPLAAGPLAGLNEYVPLTLGSSLVLLSFFVFLICRKGRAAHDPH